MLSRLLKHCSIARREIFLGGIILVLSAAVDLLQPWPIKWLVDYVFGSQNPPPFLKALLPSIGSTDIAKAIATVCFSILGLALVHRLSNTIGHFFLIRAGAKMVQTLRCEACEHLHRLPLAYHDQRKVGDSIYRVAYDAHSIQSLLNGAIVPIGTGILILCGAVIVMLKINVLLTLVTIAVAPIFLVIIRGFSRRIDEQSRRYHENESSLVSTIQESLSSIRAIQAFTMEPLTAERFRHQAESSLTANEKMTRTQLIYSACSGLAVALGTSAVVWTAGMQVAQNKLSVGDILVFLAYLGMLYQPMSTFSQSASVIQSAKAQLRRVLEILDAIPEIKDRPNAITLPTVKGAVKFQQVSFQYEPSRPVIHKLNLTVEPGQIVAIVGRTGAGKTTIASLLLRFYDPLHGGIQLDGHDLRDLKLSWLRSQVSVVLQDPILFSTTVAENIGFGKQNASREDIVAAAKRAQADDFIRDLPQGYETLLGERGVNLSGGQRQRLSIARAFLKNAPILILDEPTSALDTHTEEALLNALRELMKDRTTFVIAHRFSTVRGAHKIIVLDKGEIIEEGSHQELLDKNGAYARMYRSQAGFSEPSELVESFYDHETK